jgi:hypothetical protein
MLPIGQTLIALSELSKSMNWLHQHDRLQIG